MRLRLALCTAAGKSSDGGLEEIAIFLFDICYEGGMVGGTVALGLPEYTRKRSRLDIQVSFITDGLTWHHLMSMIDPQSKLHCETILNFEPINR